MTNNQTTSNTIKTVACDVALLIFAASGAATMAHYDLIKNGASSNFFDLVSKTSLAFIGFVITSVSIMVVLISKEEMKRVRESEGANDELWFYSRWATWVLAITAGFTSAIAIFDFSIAARPYLFCAAFALTMVSINAVRRVISAMFAIISTLKTVWTQKR